MRAVSAVVLGAGLSKRMGGPNKLLLPWADGTVLGSVLGALRQCELDVTVVTGRDAAEVERVADGARCAFNPGYEEGLGSSIAAGVAASPAGSACLVVLGDMPGLDPAVIRALLEAFQPVAPDAIVAPVYSKRPDRPGHPVLFGSVHRAALMRLGGDEGARSILQAHRDRLVLVPVEGQLSDLDTPEDFQYGVR